MYKRALPLLVVLILLTAGCGSGKKPSNTATSAQSGAPTTATTAAAAAATTTSTELTTTLRKTYAPWSGGKLASGITAASSVSGTCFAASIAVENNKAAYRCLSGNDIYDPCFAPSGVAKPAQLVCAQDPTADVRLMNLSGALPTTNDALIANPSPWAIQLDNGSQCLRLTGTTDQVGDVNLVYGCSGQNQASEVSQATQPWTVQYDPGSSSAATTADLSTVKVLTAWF